MTRLYEDYLKRHNLPSNAVPTDGILLGEKDTKPLLRGLDTIIPVSFGVTETVCIASCYPCLREEFSSLLTHMRERGDDLFSVKGLSEIDQFLRPYLAEWGYRPSPFVHRYAVSCVLDDIAAVRVDRILPATRRPETADVPYLRSFVTMKLSDCAARGAYVMMASDAPDTVACIASVNRVSGTEHFTEIGVECAPAYRGRGWATSCVAALAYDLLSHGEAVLYQHYCTNFASAAVASRAGFVPRGRFFAYSAFRLAK